MSVNVGLSSSMAETLSPTISSSFVPTTFVSSIGGIATSLATSILASSTLSPISSSTSSDVPQSTEGGGIPGLTFDFNSTTNQDYYENAKKKSDISSQFVICICAGLIFFLAFCIFRTRVPVLFSPRSNMKRHKPPELPKSLFGWIWPLLKIGDEEMLVNVGLDALLMLKFIAMGIKIFGICWIFGLVVFIPITMTSDYTHLGNDTTAISRVSIDVVESGSNKIIAYLIFAYVFTFITFYFLNKSYNEYIYLRAKYLLRQAKSLVGRSVIVTGIPSHLRSDQALSDYYEHLGVGAVESCYVVRTVHRLNTMIQKRAQALIRLEEAYATYWGNPCKIPGYDPDRILDDADLYKKVLDLAEKRPDSSSDEDEVMAEIAANGEKTDQGSSTLRVKKEKKRKHGNTTFFKGLVEPLKKSETSRRPTVRIGGFLGIGGKKVDAIEYYTKLFDDLDKTVMQRRHSPNFEMTNVAFVTFEHMSSAILASQIAISPEPFVLRTSMAYEPRDVLWSSIAIRGRERIIRETVVWTITVLLCLLWFIPVGAISSLLSIPTITKINPELGSKLENNAVSRLILNSVIPPLVLNIFTSVLPMFFDFLGYHQGLRARSAIAESTLSKQYFFLIFFTLIFYSVVNTTLMTLLSDLVKNPQELVNMLAKTLPALAPFFINYTIMQGFLIMPLNLLLLGAIVIRGFYHLFICSTPREYAENRAPWSFNYGIGYPAPLLVFAIVFEYSLICPLILLFGTVYFCITYLVYKYQFLYVYFRPYEVAGKLWTMVIPRIIFTLLLFQLTMLGLFLLRGEYVLAILMIPLVIFTFLYRYLLNLAYEQNGRHMPMQLLRDNLDTLPSSNENSDSEEDYDSEDESAAKEVAEKKAKEQEEAKVRARSRWKTAALSAVNMKAAQQEKKDTPGSKATILRPRHRKVTLDEDDYEATPDALTDYRQPPMQLNPGLLDAGLKKYGNPLLVGYLPQLWLPVKLPVDGEQKHFDAARRKSDILHRQEAGGGNVAQQLAEILRKVENENKIKRSGGDLSKQTGSAGEEQAENDLIEEARRTAHDDAASIVTGRPAHPKIDVLRSMFKRGQIKKTKLQPGQTSDAENFRLQHLQNERNRSADTSLDQAEQGTLTTTATVDTTQSDASSVKSSSQSVHNVYYHHPERRHSHAINQDYLNPHRSELKPSGLSSPAIFPSPEDDLTITITRPDTQTSRQSSDPLLKKE